jgi:hypothetical protein
MYAYYPFNLSVFYTLALIISISQRKKLSFSCFLLSYRLFCALCKKFNALNAELNPVFHLLALLGGHHILHVSGIRVTVFVNTERVENKKCLFVCLFVCLFLTQKPPVGHGLLIHDVSRSHTTTHRTQ